mmetsp:Transcript_6823/g.15311  ORF Transcript_6823/g.15311 Transcript_6823/m.15311 type:complete len:424 (-) Transcript_6823:229-1500(-)
MTPALLRFATASQRHKTDGALTPRAATVVPLQVVGGPLDEPRPHSLSSGRCEDMADDSGSLPPSSSIEKCLGGTSVSGSRALAPGRGSASAAACTWFLAAGCGCQRRRKVKARAKELPAPKTLRPLASSAARLARSPLPARDSPPKAIARSKFRAAGVAKSTAEPVQTPAVRTAAMVAICTPWFAMCRQTLLTVASREVALRSVRTTGPRCGSLHRRRRASDFPRKSSRMPATFSSTSRPPAPAEDSFERSLDTKAPTPPPHQSWRCPSAPAAACWARTAPGVVPSGSRSCCTLLGSMPTVPCRKTWSKKTGSKPRRMAWTSASERSWQRRNTRPQRRSKFEHSDSSKMRSKGVRWSMTRCTKRGMNLKSPPLCATSEASMQTNPKTEASTQGWSLTKSYKPKPRPRARRATPVAPRLMLTGA